MLIRKLLLLTLLTVTPLLSLLAQTVTVHGTVTTLNGDPVQDVSILVSAYFSDSTAIFESTLTGPDGNYSIELTVAPNQTGVVEVSMVDCVGSLETQVFYIQNGTTDLQADFLYCSTHLDSCVVYIYEEWNPGALPGLTAWIPFGGSVSYQWSTGENSPTIYPTQSGTYCVTVTSDVCLDTLVDCYEFIIDSSGFCFSYITSYLNNDGTYNLEVIASGVSPFTYAWSTGDSTSIIENVGPGTYCVTVIDANGCIYTTCIFIDDFNFCEVWIYCDFDGALVAQGYGLEPLSYLWNTGETTQHIYPSEPGAYCVTITDQNQCTASSCYQTGGGVDTFCYVYVTAFLIDSNTLALQAIGSSWSDSVTYVWNTGETGEIIYPVDLNQQYCVTMTDANGCVATGCFDSFNWCYAWVDVQYIDTASAILSVFNDPIFGWGGNSATYQWSTGETTSTINVTVSGEYCVTVTLGDNCVTEACGYVDFESLQQSCAAWVIQYPDSSGQWYAEALVWGFGTFTYEWTTGETTPVIPIDHPNEYVCVTATNSFGCETTACLDTFFNPCEVYISVEYIDNQTAILVASSWNGLNGSYTWDNGTTGPLLTVNEEGTYCVTFAGGGCTYTACIDVYFWNVDSCGVFIANEPNPLGVQLTAYAWGVEPFTYLWSNGWTEQSQIIDFGPTDLCVTVTDATGCVSTACNFPFDSCGIQLYYINYVTPQIQISSVTPLLYYSWSTGDSTPWLDITETGVYCVTVTDVWGCQTSSCIDVTSLDPNMGLNVMSGFIYADSVDLVHGNVYAYAIQPSGGIFTLVDSTRIGQGNFYQFGNLPNGLYIVKAELDPNTPGAAEFMPTYHLNSASWEEAKPIGLPNPLPVTTDIWMIRIDSTNGTGVIGGEVLDPHNIVAGEDAEIRDGTGLPGVIVILYSEEGQPINYTISDANGNFRFENLPFGTYRLSYDIPGIYAPEVWVTLSHNTPELLQVTLNVTETVDVDEPLAEEVSIYPNPAKEEIHIQLPVDQTNLQVQIVDMQGRIVHTGSVRNVNGIMLIEVGQYSPGLYHINLAGDTRSYFGRFVKQE